MSKVILALYLLAAVILVACIDTEEFDSDNMMASSYDNDTKEFGSDNMMGAGASRGLRFKRAACNTHKHMCYQRMCNRCCNPGCKGIGCFDFMCDRCCA
uniref:Uncharacterized protein n=1 Tax=Acrobeloides nanus TaxID=290746 RepID=A0A914DTH1_9BILA